MNNFFIENVEKNTIDNNNYRKVVYTGKMQFVYMSIEPLDNIHEEIHEEHDQFLRIEQGEGEAILNDKIYKLYDGIGLIIPAGTKHKIINTSKDLALKLYTIYSPPEHKPNTIHKTNPDRESETTHKKNSGQNIEEIKKEIDYKKKYIKYKSKYIQLTNKKFEK
jgi:mannose-6-phosphate isomerase-like protein (cupin superfamily)